MRDFSFIGMVFNCDTTFHSTSCTIVIVPTLPTGYYSQFEFEHNPPLDPRQAGCPMEDSPIDS
jgi:hypothetical protein